MENKEMRFITFSELWELFLQRLWIILLAVLICVAGVFVVDRVTYRPAYSSTATMYILRQTEDDVSSGDASSDFSLALKLVNDCTYILKSHTVLDQVIADLGLDMSYRELYNTVTTNNPDNTRILEVTVEADSPELAKQIVDRICELGRSSVKDAMGFEQINLFERGAENPVPSNRTSAGSYLFIGVAAAILVYALSLVLYLLDDSLRSREDIDRYLGLSILGEIPDAREIGKSRYGGYQYAYKAGSNSRHSTKGGRRA